MLRRKKIDINVNHERWLVSYADFMTLLFGFFVVMYSVSHVNEHKYEELSNSLEMLFSNAESQITTGESPIKEAAQPAIALPELAEQLTDRLSDLVDEQSIHISNNELWLQISLNNRVLFPLGSVTPSTQAEKIFADVADILRDLNNPIQVEGFTDNLRINTQQFPSNWELSSARASAIVKLLSTQGVAPQRLSAVGYGEFQPIASNESKEGRAQNRRVVLMVGKYPRQRPENSDAINHVLKVDTSTDEQHAELLNDLPQPLEQAKKSELTPVLLKNGEHLFSSDPDLPRHANE